MSVGQASIPTVEPILVVHGGAGTVARDLHEPAVRGVNAAVEVGWKVLLDGGGCEAAVIQAVRVMEDDETFNAGRGSCMTEPGEFEVDASIMRSIDMRSGAIAGVKNLRDGILVAQAVMNHTKHSLLVGDAAEAFAKKHEVGSFGRDEVWTEKAQRRYDGARSGEMQKDNRADTVGAVARDQHGNLCVAGSTGGVLLKLPGRVGDTPLIGPGFYAHPELGVAAATGVGEAIMAHVMSYELLRKAAETGDLQATADTLCRDVRAQTGSAVGLIAIRPDGQVAVAHASNHMSWAIARPDRPVQSGLTWPPTAD